jgi:hypothetical protein
MPRRRPPPARYAPAARLHELRALLDRAEGPSIYDIAERFAQSPRTAPPVAGHRSVFRKWAELLRLTFAVDVQSCSSCGGCMKLVALLKDPGSIARFLGRLGLPTEPPALVPARGPAFVRRPERRHGPSPQADIFHER